MGRNVGRLFRRWRRMARLCSASEKSFDYGRWSKWPARREHDPTEGQDWLGRHLWLTSEKSLRYGPYPSGKREETTATGDHRRFYAFFYLQIKGTFFPSLEALLRGWLTFRHFQRPARIAPLRRFWVWDSYSNFIWKTQYLNERFWQYHHEVDHVLPYLTEKLFRILYAIFFYPYS